MSRHYTLKPGKFLLRFEPSERASAHGGQMAAAGVVERFGLWKRVKRERTLDPRKDRHKGYEPTVYVAAVLFSLTSGGCTLEDVERLNEDEALKAMLGVKKFPDPTAVGEWLRNVGSGGWEALRRIGREFVAWSLERAEPARYRHAGQLECFFDDTQIEVSGPSFEGAQINYNGDLALGWQTLWVGPFLVDGVLGYEGMDVSSELMPILTANAGLWKKETSHLYADSASSAGHYLETVEAHFASWTVSYNKWVGPLEQRASEFPASYWSAAVNVKGLKGEPAVEQYAWLRYQPEGCQRPRQFAVARRRSEGELFWRYGFVACPEGSRGDPRWVFERHHLKGDRERLFSDVLRDFDLHHPPCQSLSANRVYYALALLAYNLLQALKLIWLPADVQAQRVRTLIHHLLLVPVEIKRHARRMVACFYAPAGWREWWRRFLTELLPRCHLLGALTPGG